jgi:exonuclease SbcC
MRLEKIRARHLGPFDDYTLDLSNVPGPLVAITGLNGAGKSTLLELAFPGAMYRQTPTRGSLVDLATARDSLLEVQLVNGSTWTFRHLIDSMSGKSEAVVLDAAGVSALPDTKVKSFDRWAAAHLPAPEILYSCMFAPQGAGGFLAAKPGERKATLLRVLGVERLEALAENARNHERAARLAYERILARITEARGDSPSLEAAEQAYQAARDAAELADAALTNGRAIYQRAIADARTAEDELRAKRSQAERRARVQAELDAARGTLAGVDERLRNNRAVLENAGAIRSAAKQAAELPAEIARVTGEAQTAEADAKRHAEFVRDADARLSALRSRVARATEALAGREAVAAAVAALPDLESAASDAARAVTEADTALDELQGQRVEGADDRIKFLRQGLETIVRRPANPDAVAASALEHDDTAVALARDLPSKLDAVRAAARSAKDRKAVADRKLSDARAAAARQTSLTAAEEDRRVATSEGKDLADRRTEAAAAADARAKDARALAGRAAALSAELAAAQALAARADALTRAETRIAELEPQTEAAHASVSRLETELTGTPDPGPLDTVAWPADPTPSLEAAAGRARSELVGAEQRVETARAAAGRVSALDEERARAEIELADWARLAADLGRDGLQAAEIDAAGPELTELVNAFLHECHGPRFTVRVETQRASSDGKRMLEGCEVVVLDTQNGREAAGETFSGGERVIISEALSLALTVLACRRAGIEGMSLVRDESGAALDPANARVYVAMLRRAATIVRADKVLFVAHDPEIWSLADSQISISAKGAAA